MKPQALSKKSKEILKNLSYQVREVQVVELVELHKDMSSPASLENFDF
jgi:hypothetical protein